MKTVGVIARDDDKKVIEIAEPFGVVAAIVPSTNPTSTAIYKILIAIKARCAVVLSPHPSAARCITRTAEIMHEAARAAGLPDGAIGWMTTVTLEGTQELMKAREVSVILATGGMGLVRAAYSAGKPAYGVGPGNAPCYIESSRGRRQGRSRHRRRQELRQRRALLVAELRGRRSSRRSRKLRRQFADARRLLPVAPPKADALAKAARHAAAAARTRRWSASPRPSSRRRLGVDRAAGTRALLAELKGVGRDYPLSIEKLCPVLSYYVVKRLARGLRALQADPALRRHGPHHVDPLAERRGDPRVRPAQAGLPHRVNTPTTHGSIGLTTGLDPAMTLGCGGFGGNITSDNISPRHLLNIKRLAYGIREAPRPAAQPSRDIGSPGALAQGEPSRPPLPKAPPSPEAEPVSAATLASRIDQFLASRGVARPGEPPAASSRHS